MKKSITLFICTFIFQTVSAQINDSTVYQYARIRGDGIIVRAYYENEPTEDLKKMYQLKNIFYSDANFNSFFFIVINHLRKKGYELFAYDRPSYVEFIFRKKVKTTGK